MPYRRKYTKKYKPRRRRRYGMKKFYKKKRYLPLGGFPTSKLVRLKYVHQGLLDAPASGIAQYQFRANSVFDPDYSGIGHAPMNFNRWASIYDRYTVVGSKCKFTLLNSNSTNRVPPLAGILLSSDSGGTSTVTAITDLLENKMTGNRWINTGSTDVSNPNKSATVTSYFSAKKFFGVTNVMDGAVHSALVTANPTRDAYFNVWCASISGNNPDSAPIMVEIEYIVLFQDPVTEAQN